MDLTAGWRENYRLRTRRNLSSSKLCDDRDGLSIFWSTFKFGMSSLILFTNDFFCWWNNDEGFRYCFLRWQKVQKIVVLQWLIYSSVWFLLRLLLLLETIFNQLSLVYLMRKLENRRRSNEKNSYFRGTCKNVVFFFFFKWIYFQLPWNPRYQDCGRVMVLP